MFFKEKVVSFFCFFIFLAQPAFGQNIIKKSVVLSSGKASLENVLDELARKGQFKLSYSPNFVPTDSLVNKLTIETTVKKHLKAYLNKNFALKENGGFLIIIPTEKHKENTYEIRGYVVNKKTNEKVANATVYDPHKYHSTLTDNAGFYALQVSSRNDLIPISISKENYIDTVLFVSVKTEKAHVAAIKPIVIEKVAPIETQKLVVTSQFKDLNSVRFFVPSYNLASTKNIDYMINSPAQISFLPSLGSNRRLGGIVNNNFSFNVLAGYSAGVQGVEIGGLVNIDRYNVEGFQLGGLGNVVGNNVSGMQVGGLFNNVRGTVNGVQIGGFQNISLDSLRGVQIAGFFNYLSGDMNGAQIGGFGNICAQSVDGLQIAGFGNIAKKGVSRFQIGGFFNTANGNVGGMQIAGFANVCKRNVNGFQIGGFGNFAHDSIGGVQIGGFINTAENVESGQIAGFINIATQEIKGLQLSGFLNIANELNGLQFGVLNISKSGKGVPIGIISYMKMGYQSLGLVSTEFMPLAISGKTGVRQFYNIFSIGANKGTWGYAYGIGGKKRWNDYFGRTIEANFWQIHEYGNMIFDTNLLTRFSYQFNYETRWFTLMVGPAYNWQILSLLIPEAKVFAPYKYDEFTLGNTLFAHWWGFQVELNFN